MNSKFIMDVLEHPQNYTKDQRKIAIQKAMELIEQTSLCYSAKEPQPAPDGEGGAVLEGAQYAVNYEVWKAIQSLRKISIETGDEI